MEFRDTIAAIRAGWFLPVIGMLLGGGVGAAMALMMTPTYTSSAQVWVTSTDATSTTAAFQGSQFAQNRVASYVQILGSERLAEGVIERLDLDLTPSGLQQRVEPSVVPDTTVLGITVTDTSPQRARDIAAAVAAEFTELVIEVETTTTTPTEPDAEPVTTVPVKVTVLDTPEVAEQPTAPNLYANIAVGVLIGLLVGLALAYARVRLDRSVRDAKVASDVAGAPVIGTIARDPKLASGHVLERNSRSGAAEAFRQLRTNLQFLNVDQPPRVIMVSSAVAAEGKSTVAVNLALTLAEGGHRVALVESDLRHPRVVRYLGLVDGAGLTSTLTGAAELDDVLQPYGNGRLSVLGAGSIPPNPSELLASDQLRAVVDQLRATHDYVIVDTPPLLPVADASAVAVVMDGVLLTARQGKTRREELERAAAVLDRVGARMLGVILTMAPPSSSPAAYGYDGDAPTEPEPKPRPAAAQEKSQAPGRRTGDDAPAAPTESAAPAAQAEPAEPTAPTAPAGATRVEPAAETPDGVVTGPPTDPAAGPRVQVPTGPATTEISAVGPPSPPQRTDQGSRS
ncbi:polysaccharide biosynthesis tyrosine autokinase [Blastococcus sp. KM273128]|uniref:polysaccharide biosynthesis tyrosine autokinase n=1 Tax=Blastococcus sp. KM273128 TaxID=2570314 RepID=UPI001EFFCAD7|nr:polysaccharide biosynthesis tyrosine autokinase [Blastococcus sp. KM273128]MCF6745956.1 polysaccharide biosynthesis tyrosine autokinase [Blastococcus sp. KM273128]